MSLDDNHRKLWQHVLLSTWSEARGNRMPTSEGQETKSRYHQEAIDYLTTPSEDLRILCEYADIEYDVVLNKAREEFGDEHRRLPE